MEFYTNSAKKKDVERFLKFFVIKSIQVIVQSRTSCNKVKTECRLPTDGGHLEWFNLQIKDDLSILTQTHTQIHHMVKDHSKIVVEVYLKNEEVKILLEVWRFQVDKPSLHNAKDVINIYNRLALLLKSIITVTRVTPAYKIARRGGSEVGLEWELKSSSNVNEEDLEEEKFEVEIDSFEEDLKLLGDGFKAVEVGRVPLTTSSLNKNFLICNLYYRTKMEVLTTSNLLLIHSNHYGENCVREKKKVRAAFGSIESLSSPHLNSDSGPEENFLKLIPGGEFLLSQKEKLSMSVVYSQEVSIASKEDPIPLNITFQCPQKIHCVPEEEKKITIPFAEPQTSSSSSETELLNLFEEFRVAPSSLHFSENCQVIHGSGNNQIIK